MKDKKNIAKKIKPLADRVLIVEEKEAHEKKTSSGIIIPATVNADRVGKRGRVVAVGPGRIEEGELVKMSVKEGDTVLFQWGDMVRIDDEDYHLVKEYDILAIIK